MLFIVLGIFSALGLYLNLLGVTGHGLYRYGALALGWGQDIVPIGLIAAGISLIASPRGARTGRVLGSLALLCTVSSGLAELAGASPSIHASSVVLGGAGGVLGAAIGRPLGAAIGSAGSVVLFLVLVAFALSVISGIGPRRALGLIGQALKAAAQAIASLFSLPLGAIDQAARAPAESLLEARFPTDLPPGGEEPRPIFDAMALEEPVAEPVATDQTASHQVPSEPEPAVLQGEQLGLGVVAPPSDWRLPPQKLLVKSAALGMDRRAVEERGKVLERALRAHGVETNLAGFTVGPTVTRFELELGAGVKVARVTSLAKDIAYAMASPDVRILAPIPGRSAIGVEVPNVDRQLVTLGDVLSTDDARRAKHPLEVAIGRDIAGRAVMVNLAEMPHLLIAGATGAGKSSCINSLVSSLLMRSTPEEVRLILVDPKRVELGQYNGLPHLLTPVVVNPKRAANALSWAVAEMERRYDLLAEAGMRDITGYNAAFDRGDFAPSPLEAPFAPRPSRADAEGLDELSEEADLEPEAEAAVAASASRFTRLPFILVIVDELNDLMMVAARDVEDSICRIAQMARAVGIHLVIATQRPSVDVITGVIKANIPSRLAFSVSSLADSRVILDQPGAERLIGRGDLLLLGASSSSPRRIQAPWISEEEIHALVGHWRRQAGPNYLDGVVGEDAIGASKSGASEEDDDLLAQALELVVRSQLGSTSMLQRKLRVGFSRAGRLMDLLERRGVVGPSEGSKARAVLLSPDELDSMSR